MTTFTIDTSPLVDKAIRQLAATSTFLREIPVLDSNKTNFLNQRIRTALKEIRKIVDAQREYDARQLDETTKFSTKPRPDAEAVAKEHADFIVKEVRSLLNKKDVEVYEYRVVNPIDAQLNKENLELKELLKQKTIELQTAQQEIARLKTELAKLTLDKEALEKALAAEKLKFSGLLKAKLKVDTRLKELERLLNKEKSDRAADVTALQAQLNQKEQELQTEKTNNSARIPILEGDILTLQGRLATLQNQLSTEQSDRAREKANLEQQLKQKESELSALQSGSQAEKEKLEQELSDLRQVYAALQLAEQALIQNNTSLLEANRTALAANEKLKKDHEAELLLKTREISALKQKLEDLQKALSEAQADAIKRRAERAGDAAVIYEQEKSKLQAEIDALREQLKQVEAEYQSKLAILQSQLAIQPAAPTSLPADLQKIRDLQARIDELENTLQEEVEKTAAALKDGETYQSKISELTEEIESLKIQLVTALQTATQQSLELSSSRAETQSTAEELERLKVAHAAQIATLTARIKELEAQLATKPTSVSAERDTQDLDAIIRILSNLQGAHTTSLAFDLAVNDLKNLELSDRKAIELQEQLITLFNEYSDTIAKSTKKEKEIQSVAPLSEVPEIQEVSSTEQDRINSLEAQIKQLQESEETAKDSLADALQKNTELTSQLQQITKQLENMTEDRDTILSKYKELIAAFLKIGSDLGITISIAEYDDPKDTREIIEFLSQFTIKIQELKERIRETAVREGLQNVLKEIGNKIQNVTFDAKKEFGQLLSGIADRIEAEFKSVQKQVNNIYGSDIPLDLEESYNLFVSRTENLISDFRDAAKIMSNNEARSSKIFDTSYNVTGEMYGAVVSFTKKLEKQWQTRTESIINIMQESFETAMNSVQTVIRELQSDSIPEEARSLYSKSLRKFETLASDTSQRLQSWVALRSQPTQENPNEFAAMRASIATTAEELAQIWREFRNTLQEALTSVIQGDQMLRAQLDRANQRLALVNSTTIDNIAESLGLDQGASESDITERVQVLLNAAMGQAEKLQQIASQLNITEEYNPDTILDTILKAVTSLQQNMGIPKSEYQKKLGEISSLEAQIKQLEEMNASVVASNERLSKSNVTLSQQLKLAQMGIPQQMRSGIGAPQPVFDEADLRELEEVQGGNQHVSGGYDSTTYTPIIAAATGSLLWWGFGGLLVFLILIVIYLLGREIYRTQFKSETDRKNIVYT